MHLAPPAGGAHDAVMTASRPSLSSDLWGGLSAMLVALPASLAFGVSVTAPLGPAHVGTGAIAGLLGAFAMGVVAAATGGAPRLVSAPCAPAAAVMGAFALGLSHDPARDAASMLLLLSLTGLLAGALQVVYGALGGGTLIKYIPYPVVTGYLSGVALVIFLKQLPSFLGLAAGHSGPAALIRPELWNADSVVIGGVTIAAVLAAPRLTRAIPAPIIGVIAGVAAYFTLALRNPALLTLSGNPLVVGSLPDASAIRAALMTRASGLPHLSPQDLALILGPALTLSVLLSIDTLKTCVLVDAMTRSRHDSNREVRAQGLANMLSALIGGMPGAGTSGATLMNLASGAATWRSGAIAGGLSLLAYLLFRDALAWAPIPALAAVLLVVAARMFDWKSFGLARQRSTVLDFAVIAAVIGIAVFVDLIAASLAGVLLSILLFTRDHVRARVIRRKLFGGQVFSRRRRPLEQVQALRRRSRDIVIAELQGDLFFGTTDQLLTEIEPDLAACRYLILDLRRIESIDFTGVHLLQQIDARVKERDGRVLYSNLPHALPSGIASRQYFAEVGLISSPSSRRIFPQMVDALEWAEDAVLADEGLTSEKEEALLALDEIDFIRGRKAETMREFEEAMESRHYEPGEAVFRQGDAGDELFLVRRGRIRISFRTDDGGEFHVATFSRGDFFGDMAFLDAGIRSADAIAEVTSDVYAITRPHFDALAERHPRLGGQFMSGLARALALRLRQADGEIRALEDA